MCVCVFFHNQQSQFWATNIKPCRRESKSKENLNWSVVFVTSSVWRVWNISLGQLLATIQHWLDVHKQIHTARKTHMFTAIHEWTILYRIENSESWNHCMRIWINQTTTTKGTKQSFFNILLIVAADIENDNERMNEWSETEERENRERETEERGGARADWTYKLSYAFY